jgi:hypothetical protein
MEDGWRNGYIVGHILNFSTNENFVNYIIHYYSCLGNLQDEIALEPQSLF